MDPFLKLPSLLFHSICENLSYKDKLTIRGVCRRFKAEIHQKSSWTTAKSIILHRTEDFRYFFNGHEIDQTALNFHFEFCWSRFVKIDLLKIIIDIQSNLFVIPDCILYCKPPPVKSLIVTYYPRFEELLRLLQGTLTSFTLRHSPINVLEKNRELRSLFQLLTRCQNLQHLYLDCAFHFHTPTQFCDRLQLLAGKPLKSFHIYRIAKPLHLIHFMNQLPPETLEHLGISPIDGGHFRELFENTVQLAPAVVLNVHSLTIRMLRNFGPDLDFLGPALGKLPNLQFIDIRLFETEYKFKSAQIKALCQHLLKHQLNPQQNGLSLRVPLCLTEIDNLYRSLCSTEYEILICADDQGLPDRICNQDLQRYKLCSVSDRDHSIRLIVRLP